ncbi:hypothetical protein SDC9_05901 [bioreactor metagenome]|uniref:Uncharacterized protein n=1 Tax=bioreactor metagenome TaxID=1076179 RepID=A0A644T2A0_9ZZZZ
MATLCKIKNRRSTPSVLLALCGRSDMTGTFGLCHHKIICDLSLRFIIGIKVPTKLVNSSYYRPSYYFEILSILQFSADFCPLNHTLEDNLGDNFSSLNTDIY